MAQETDDRTADPGGSGVENEYGGGTDEDEDEIAGRPEG